MCSPERLGCALPRALQDLDRPALERGGRRGRLLIVGELRHERRRDPFSRDAEEKLSRRLHAKVRIVRRRRGGEIQIRFGSEEELIGLFERLAKN